MFEKDITKDAEITLGIIYKHYLQTMKSTNDQFQSIGFYDFAAIEDDINKTIGINRFEYSIYELAEIGFVKKYVDGGFRINSQAIVYMENRFGKTLSGVIDIISKFIP